MDKPKASNPKFIDLGWQNLEAGIALIEWSRIAKWNATSRVFDVTKENIFEESDIGHQAIRPVFGRLICWITFETGAEYLLKAICLIRSIHSPKPKKALRALSRGESINEWVKGVLDKSDLAYEDTNDLLAMGNLPTTKLFKNCVNQEQCKASFEWLRDAARNRDAHQYAKDVRALQFYTIEALIVPMLNTALNTIDWEEQPDTFSK